MAPAAKDSEKGATKATKAAPKAKATKAAPKKKDAPDSAAAAASPAKGRKRAADALEEEVAPLAKMDAPVKAAKKDVAKKEKAKAAAAAKDATTAAAAPAAAAAAAETKPKAKKAKTAKAAEADVKADDKPAEPAAAKGGKKKADGEAKPKKATKAKAAAPAADKDGDAKPAPAKAKGGAKKDAKPKDEGAAAAAPPAVNGDKPKAAPKPRKRKASAVEDGEGKPKPATSAAAKKQKTTTATETDLSQSLLSTVGASLQAATRRISGLFTSFGASGSDEAEDSPPVKPKKPAAKRASKAGGAAAKASAAAAAATGETAEGARYDAALIPAHSDGDNQEDDRELEAAALLGGFASSDEDAASGDEGFAPGMQLPALPTAKGLAKRLKGAGAADGEQPGVIYVGRIPHGFHEHEMRAYFSQFGDVQHVRLSRSRRTGASKHYGFVQFASAAVAAIAAETMDNYLMFGHILKCRVVPPAQVHPRLWDGADRRFKAVPWSRIEGRKIALPKSRAEWDRKVAKEAARRDAKSATLRESLGYEFEAPLLKGSDAVPAKIADAAVADAPQLPSPVSADAPVVAVTLVEETTVVTTKPKASKKRKSTDAAAAATEPATATATGKAKKAKKAKA